MCKRLIYVLLLRSSVQSNIGATEPVLSAAGASSSKVLAVRLDHSADQVRICVAPKEIATQRKVAQSVSLANA
jgi:hypothetical protein